MAGSKQSGDNQTFSAETVACLLAVMEKAGVSVGLKHYELMAKLDGNRTKSSFEHQFRKVKARGKELQGELSDVATPTKAGKAKNTTTTPSTGKKRALNNVDDNDGDDKEEPPMKLSKPDDFAAYSAAASDTDAKGEVEDDF